MGGHGGAIWLEGRPQPCRPCLISKYPNACLLPPEGRRGGPTAAPVAGAVILVVAGALWKTEGADQVSLALIG